MESGELLESWVCEGPCQQLMYNKDEEGYPCPGAPVGFTIHPDEQELRVCSTCADMYISLAESRFMRRMHGIWVISQARKERLKSGHEYLE